MGVRLLVVAAMFEGPQILLLVLAVALTAVMWLIQGAAHLTGALRRRLP